MNSEYMEGNNITLYTGRGGIKEFIKAWCEQAGMEYNIRNFIRVYKFCIRSGFVKRYRHKKNE